MKTGKHQNTQWLGDKRRDYTIEFEECLIECRVLFSEYLTIHGLQMEHEILDMDIFDPNGDRVPLSSINEEELDAIIEPLIKY